MGEEIIQLVFVPFVSTVVAAIVGALVSKVKTIRRVSEEARAESDALRGLMQQNIVMTCRMAIYDDHFSVDEKLDAYKIYRENGGNHKTKTFMDELVGCDVDEYLEKHDRKERK